jgi:DNA-binding transcriptional ArsR family regulator
MPSQELPKNIGSREMDIMEELRDDGELSVTELRRRLGLSNTEVNYSLKKLSERDLIELRHPPDNGPIPDPKQANLTAEGLHALDYWGIDTEGLSLAERVEVLERRLQQERKDREALGQRVQSLLGLTGVNGGSALPDLVEVRRKVYSLDRHLAEVDIDLSKYLTEQSTDEAQRLRRKAEEEWGS